MGRPKSDTSNGLSSRLGPDRRPKSDTGRMGRYGGGRKSVLSHNRKKFVELSYFHKKFANLSRRRDSGEGKNPREGLQGGMRRYGGGRKSMKEDKIKAVI